MKRIWRQGDIAGSTGDENNKLTAELKDYEPPFDDGGGASKSSVSPAVISTDFETIVQHAPRPSNISRFSVSSKESLSCTRIEMDKIQRDNIPPELYKVAKDVSRYFFLCLFICFSFFFFISLFACLFLCFFFLVSLSLFFFVLFLKF